jgi:hydrogenase/urease accessory protein HupE
MKTNRLSKISLCLAAATLLIVVGFVWLSFPETSSEESHVAGALMSPAIFVIAAMIGVAFGVIGFSLPQLP